MADHDGAEEITHAYRQYIAEQLADCPQPPWEETPAEATRAERAWWNRHTSDEEQP